MLRARGLKKNYGEIEALRGVDLDVDEGSVVALLGRNGAGKSTALSIISGLLRPDAGSVEIGGTDIWRTPTAAARLVGIAPQETGIYRVLTVRENLDFFATLAGVARPERSRRIDDIAERLGLTQLLDRSAAQLSGGEARRLHTGCALVHSPPLLLLDEPTVGADVATRNQLIDAVRDLAAQGSAVIYTTHYLPEVEALDAEIVVIDHGQICARGTAAELIAQHFEPGIDLTFRSAEGMRAASGAAALSALEPAVRTDGRLHLAGAIALDELTSRLGDHAAGVVSVETTRPSLEQVFLEITGSSLTDDAATSDIPAGATS